MLSRLFQRYDFGGCYSARDVAYYIVEKCSADKKPISNLQLQKILYNIQRYFIQNRKKALFMDEIEAWPFGPVVRDVYERYSIFGASDLYNIDDMVVEFPPGDKQDIDKIIEEKRSMRPWNLVEESHEKGKAWDIIFRDGLGYKEVIPKGVIANYG